MIRRPRKLRPYGTDALLLEWEPVVDETINRGVHAYAAAVREIDGVKECVPAYASLLLRFDRSATDYYELGEHLLSLKVGDGNTARRTVRLPVYYAGEDLEAVAAVCKLSVAEVIDLHTGTEYRAYCLGFRPGFAYLGEVDERLRVPRRDSPRRQVPAGAVGLADRQTGIYPVASPGGWQLIGRTPVTMLIDEPPYSLIGPGDSVRFEAIDGKRYQRLQKDPAAWQTS